MKIILTSQMAWKSLGDSQHHWASLRNSFVYYSSVWICHNLFPHSHVDEHLDCFQFGAIMNEFSMGIIVYVFWYNTRSHTHAVLLSRYLEVELLHSRVLHI